MSLTLEGFTEACENSGKIRARLEELFGFAPMITNHYGTVRMYNQVIEADTPTETLLMHRAKYLEWKAKVVELFREKCGILPSDEQLDGLFRVDLMFGTLCFMDILIDIYGDFEPYRSRIISFLEMQEGREVSFEYWRFTEFRKQFNKRLDF